MTDDELLQWASSLHGHPVVVRHERRGDNTRVWSLDATAGDGLVVKSYGPGRGLDQELRALNLWAPRLPCWTPRVLGQHSRQRWLALSRMNALPVQSPDLTVAAVAAGQSLRALHALPLASHDPVDLTTALARRFESVLSRTRALVDRGLWLAARALLTCVSAETTPRVPCHRDFGPHNWLWAGGELGLLDFEHARADHPLSDWVKVLCLPSATREPVLEGLGLGYGGVPPPSMLRTAMVVAQCLATIAWHEGAGSPAAADATFNLQHWLDD